MAGPLTSLLRAVADDPAFIAVAGLKDATVAVAEGGRAAVVGALALTGDRRPILVAVPTGAEAERLASDLATFLGAGEVELFPAWETLPFERVSPSVETMGRRMRVMWRLRDPQRAPAVVVAPARALVQRLGPHVEDVEPIHVEVGSQVDLAELIERLVLSGYRREYQVEHRGEVAVRGSIVDVFPSTSDAPIRMDLWGDEVDRLCEFAVADQRAGAEVGSVEVFPCRELLPTREVSERAQALIATAPWGREQWQRLADGETFDGMESWLPWVCERTHVLGDLLPDDALVLAVEPHRFRARATEIVAEETDLADVLAGTWAATGEMPRLHVDEAEVLGGSTVPLWKVLASPDGPSTPRVSTSGWAQAVGDASVLFGQIRDLAGAGYRVAVAAEGAGSAERVASLLREHGMDWPVVSVEGDRFLDPGGRIVAAAPLERGVVLPEAKVAILSEADLTGRRRTHRAARPRRRAAQGFFDDLGVGSYVVHHHHGVARFAGMVKRTIGGTERDYLLLEYRGDDKLYVPSDQIDAVRLYSGGETPRLSKMGGADFARTKATVREEVHQIAQELVVLYQKRLHTSGHAFGPDTPWQLELEAAFPYQETPDQLQAIADVKADMESDRPMDRLVCGDVGFGKTEVALRAAFKAIQEGKQVAVLVPTTLLAQQHHSTFSERLAPYPIRVEVLSRFLTNAEAKAVAKGVSAGEVDLVIGTHRLLSEDISFQRLGLLVVDEEQRFGVSHKEAIKKLSEHVDVLTLTATPIPRTLEMSLTGIRDLSLLQTPPAERQPILTYVGDYDERAVSEAIRRELLRDGQVFFVHNRVADIELVANGLRELVPEARVSVAHGQMDEGTLERVVVDFWEGSADVLVCTTIIESGIDMPTVNTLVVDRADMLGLGQLHQLRGRVGRAGQRAYAYLFHPPDRELTEEAYERLRTIGESTELGSGFRIAMRDLEIRGAGNLLGTGQSGHVAAVGYDLYCQMVSEAIDELNGVETPSPAEIKIDLPLDAHLPLDYIERDDLRFDAYRRLAEVRTQSEVDDLAAEWVDRFGPVPQPAAMLVEIARLRAHCAAAGVTDITVVESKGIGAPRWMARLSPLKIPVSKQLRLERLRKGSVVKPDPREVHIPVPTGDAMVGSLREFFEEFVEPVDPG
ncbi:MAG: transcription-repair coupling factor [Microthrixaceae bacterium]|nr:transcription-repair coupling factor [Microthrixaceae bacterium]